MREATKSPRVLVVEDEPDLATIVQECLRECLRDIAPEIVLTFDFAEAAAVLAGGAVALVLTDSLYNPTTDQFAERWTRLDHLRALAGPVPVVLSTAYAEREFADYRDHGIDDLLGRPFELAMLCAVVRRHLGLAGDAAR
ncbi:MAG TPA: response regulator [Thermomicrobiales bacterium]|nr:response regulator [Thermomicrobiales bacterium]